MREPVSDEVTAPDDDEQLRHPGHLGRRLQQISYVAWAQVVSTNVTPPQFLVMRILAQHPGVNQATLSQIARFDQSTIADIVRRLISKGYLQRSHDPTDGRRKRVALTQVGFAHLEALEHGAAEMNRLLLSELSVSERRAFLELAQRVIESAEGRFRSGERRRSVRGPAPKEVSGTLEAGPNSGSGRPNRQ